MNGYKKIIILISIILFSSVSIIIIPTRAIIKDQTISTIAEKDTYVNSYEGMSNYEGQDYIRTDFYYSKEN